MAKMPPPDHRTPTILQLPYDTIPWYHTPPAHNAPKHTVPSLHHPLPGWKLGPSAAIGTSPAERGTTSKGMTGRTCRPLPRCHTPLGLTPTRDSWPAGTLPPGCWQQFVAGRPLATGPGQTGLPYWRRGCPLLVPVLGDARQRVHISLTNPRVKLGVKPFPPYEVGPAVSIPFMTKDMVNLE